VSKANVDSKNKNKNKTIEQRIYELVCEENLVMKRLSAYSNRTRLYDRVETIIYNDWGFLNRNVQKIIEQYVNEIIPEEED
jgi:hypothetical protein